MRVLLNTLQPYIMTTTENIADTWTCVDLWLYLGHSGSESSTGSLMGRRAAGRKQYLCDCYAALAGVTFPRHSEPFPVIVHFPLVSVTQWLC